MCLPRARALETMAMLLCLWGVARFASEAWPDGETPISQVKPKPVYEGQFAQPKGLVERSPWARRHIVAHTRQMDGISCLPDTILPKSVFQDAMATPAQIPVTGPIGLFTYHFGTRVSDQPVLGSFWLLARSMTGTAFSPAGSELGGSQMGARVRLPLFGQDLAVNLRASSNLNLSRGKEVALGLSWRPLDGVAAEIIAEQRLGLDAQGRTDPALLLAVGLNDMPIGGGMIAEGYGQIGGVGFPKVDEFGDGRLTLTARIHPRLRLGMGIWGGVQPQASRVDIGPTLLISDRQWRATLDWRIRIAGGAHPTSGPSITFGRNF